MAPTAPRLLNGRDNARGFTLLELVICVAILAILAIISRWGIRRATEAARSFQCSSQLRQVYTGLALYAQDNRGMLPPATEPNSRDYTWDVAWRGPWCSPREQPEKGFPAYVAGGVEAARKLVLCPINLRATPNYRTANPFRHYYLCNYDLMTSSGFSDPPARLFEIQLHNTVLLLDSAMGDKWQSVGIPSRAYQQDTWNRIGEPHDNTLNTLNILWADGHVTNTKKSALLREDFTRKPR